MSTLYLNIVFGNSGYGKSIERVDLHKDTIILTDEKKLWKYTRKPHFRTSNFIPNEEERGFFEITLDKKRVIDGKPVHVGLGIG